MAITRSVPTRMLEGVRRDFLADADVAGYFLGGVLIGPLFGNDAIVKPPQINLALGSSWMFDPGMTGAATLPVPIIAKVHFPYTIQTFTVGGVTPLDWLRHLKAILLRGGADANNHGKLVDPDAPASPTPVQKYLNTTAPSFQEMSSAVMPGNVSILYPFTVTYGTRLDDLTMQRV